MREKANTDPKKKSEHGILDTELGLGDPLQFPLLPGLLVAFRILHTHAHITTPH